jgi:ABC-2 type transport system permease protein
VWAVVLRHLITYTRGLDKINTLFYWPFINIGIFGLTAYTASNENVVVVGQILACVGAWQIMLRVALEAGTLVFQEVSSQNIVNLLATPLTSMARSPKIIKNPDIR